MIRLKKSQIPAHKQKLLEAQGGKCRLCNIDLITLPTKDLCLDHCHRHGVIRGVLCRNCNGIEGKIFNLANRGKRGYTPAAYLAMIVDYWRDVTVRPDSVYHPDHRTEEEKRLKRNAVARVAAAKKRAMKNLGA